MAGYGVPLPPAWAVWYGDHQLQDVRLSYRYTWLSFCSSSLESAHTCVLACSVGLFSAERRWVSPQAALCDRDAGLPRVFPVSVVHFLHAHFLHHHEWSLGRAFLHICTCLHPFCCCCCFGSRIIDTVLKQPLFSSFKYWALFFHWF